MKNISRIAEEIVQEKDLQSGWERVTIILNREDFQKLKSISDIKSLFVKDIVNELIKVYNRVAITDKDKENIQKEKENLENEIKKLVRIQEEIKKDEKIDTLSSQ